MSESAETPEKITLKVKMTSAAHDIEVPKDATIQQVKQVLSEKVGSPIERLCLIFSGKILKDNETLAQHSIGDNMAIHLVIRQQQAGPAATSQSGSTAPQAQPTASPQGHPLFGSTAGGPTAAPLGANPPNPFGGLFGSGVAGGGMANVAQQMLNNPDAISNMLSSPLMQNLLNNPSVFRSILTENPQIQQLMESNPELSHILNDPEMIRQTMEMVRNPNMFQEMMRNHDQSIRNLQGLPGGEAALQRLYREVQEPLLNSATSSLGGNPFASLVQDGNDANASSRSQRAGVENAEALPNPWATPSNNQQRPPGGTPNIPGLSGAMLNSPGMSSLMNQMMSDPSLMQSLMSPEVMQNMQQTLTQNPQLMEQLLGANPMMANNPALLEQMRSQLPNISNNMPEIMAAMSNPRVIEAIQQIQTGYDTLRREAPSLSNMFMSGGMGAVRMPNPSSDQSAVPDQLGALQNLFSSMNTAGGAAAAGNPEEMYAAQLEQLRSMGFNNTAENIAALRASFGDLNAAVERLLQR